MTPLQKQKHKQYHTPKITIYMGRSNNNTRTKYIVLIPHPNQQHTYQTIHFGIRGTPNFTTTHDTTHKNNYILAHTPYNNVHDKTLWKKPNYWERWILWNKTSKRKSIQYLQHKLNIHILPIPTQTHTHKHIQAGHYKTKTKTKTKKALN